MAVFMLVAGTLTVGGGVMLLPTLDALYGDDIPSALRDWEPVLTVGMLVAGAVMIFACIITGVTM